MNKNFTINSGHLSLEDLQGFLANDPKITIGDDAREKIEANRKFLEKKIAEPGARYYGINTGFGALCDVEIAPDQLEQLQENLVMSHACGMGDEVKHEVIKLMVLLKLKGLSLGYSGISNETVTQLVDMYNHGILPVIWEVGSLGASGDLAPLAHLSLPLLGMGTVRYNGDKLDSATALKKVGMQPIKLKAKEGLALLNGTQFMSAWGCYAIMEAERVAKLADLNAAISADGFYCQLSPYHPAIQRVRNHSGQIESAANILKFLEGSEIAKEPKNNVQDPYSFRCVPQVHGAVKFAIGQVKEVFEKEINAVTDNPLIFEEEDLILSGGNFHGEPLAIGLDYLGIAMSELASISERRTFQLISGKRGLPKFLVEDSGLNSGLMIPQYTAASIVSMNKQLATPASVDTITSSDGQEDHVSMGANAAVKTYKIVYNIEKVLAIEFMTAMQALDFRKPLKSSPLIEKIRADYRKLVPYYDKDRVLYDDIQVTVDFMRTITL